MSKRWGGLTGAGVAVSDQGERESGKMHLVSCDRVQKVAYQPPGSKHIHPHDDEPDPTAYMGNYNFPQMLFAFCLGFATMFVLAVDTVNDFKGCPLPEYFQKEVKG